MIIANSYGFAILCAVTTHSYAQQGTLTDPRDGRVYKTIEIKNMTWMAENLDYHGRDMKRGGACYNNDWSLCRQYGALYTWDDAMKACPLDWHVATKAEYDSLMAYAGSNKESRYSGLVKGGATGMNMLLTGWVHTTVVEGFSRLGKAGWYWTSTEVGKSEVYHLMLTTRRRAVVVRSWKHDLQSVRCVKD